MEKLLRDLVILYTIYQLNYNLSYIIWHYYLGSLKLSILLRHTSSGNQGSFSSVLGCTQMCLPSWSSFLQLRLAGRMYLQYLFCIKSCFILSGYISYKIYPVYNIKLTINSAYNNQAAPIIIIIIIIQYVCSEMCIPGSGLQLRRPE